MQEIKFQIGQWTYTVEGYDPATGTAQKLRGINPSKQPGGPRRFYMMETGQFGQPLFTADPDMAFEVPSQLVCVDVASNPVTLTEKIGGIMCLGVGPKPQHRYSLTSAAEKTPVAIEVVVNDDGSIQVDGEKWWVAALIQKDRNRIFNYDAILVRDQPDQVFLVELGDLPWLLFGGGSLKKAT